MAQAGSAYNLHERHKENHVKIGNWVEERALIESAPGMCIPVRTHFFRAPMSSNRCSASPLTRAPAAAAAGVGRPRRGGEQDDVVEQDAEGAPANPLPPGCTLAPAQRCRGTAAGAHRVAAAHRRPFPRAAGS